MKRIFAMLLVLVMVVGLVACAPKEEEGYEVTMWVSEKEGVKEQFQSQIDAFLAANPDVKLTVKIEGVSEANAASQVLADVASAPDMYCFAQDQLARLVQASALLAPGKSAAATIESENDAGSVAAAKVAGTLYAYPLTSDNGYFMYYDTSIISETDALDLATIVAKAEGANKQVRFALENAWYTASFFFATGCTHDWTTNEKGQFVSVNDTWNSDAGMIAMKGMRILAKSSCYNSDADSFDNAAVVVSGTWNIDAAKAHFGDNLGITKLPSFTVDGNSYQLGSYSGYKLLGVKPQEDAEKGAILSRLAQYLTNTENQLARFNTFGWGPSNKAAQENEAVKADLALTALAAQNAYATPQGQIAGVFWDNAKLLGAAAKQSSTTEELQKALNDYTKALEDFCKLTPEQREAFTVIGGIKDSGWGADFEMKEDPAGTWTSVEAFDLAEGTEFKVRKGMSWDIAFGDNDSNADSSVPTSNKANFVVKEAGKYYIKITLNEDQSSAVIELVPAE